MRQVYIIYHFLVSCSVLLYKPAANYAIAASKSSIVLYYLSSYSAGPVGSLSLTPGYWHHITVTAYQQDVSFYVNGTFVYAIGLGNSIVDQSGDILIGQGYGGKGLLLVFCCLIITLASTVVHAMMMRMHYHVHYCNLFCSAYAKY